MRDATWLILNPETNAKQDSTFGIKYPYQEYYILSHEELSKAMSVHPTQFIWGRLLLFKDNIAKIVGIDNLPWHQSALNEEYNDALLEIVCFDSTETIIFSTEESIYEYLKSEFHSTTYDDSTR